MYTNIIKTFHHLQLASTGGGYLQCLYSKTDGYSYATLYNNDTSTDESSTFLFSCLVSNPSSCSVINV